METDPDIPTVRVIIVNYNGGDYLARCLGALVAQDGAAWEAVVVDNGSTDGSLDALPARLRDDPRIRIDMAGANLGFAAANNRGAAGAKTRWIACLNPDAFARPGWLATLVSTAEALDTQMAGSTQVFADTPHRLDGLGDGYHISGLAWRMGFGAPVADAPTEPYPVFGPCAAASLYDRELFEAVGGFDERFFCYHEDVDLSLRLRRAGGACVQVPGAVVDHVSSGITGRASDFAVYHGTRNRMWTFVGSMPGSALVLFGPLHIAMTLAIMAWSLVRPGRARPTWRGVRDGLRGLPAVWRTRGEVPSAVGLRGLWPHLAVAPGPVLRRRRVPSRARL